jgi:hypothetical protein
MMESPEAANTNIEPNARPMIICITMRSQLICIMRSLMCVSRFGRCNAMRKTDYPMPSLSAFKTAPVFEEVHW